MKQQWKEDEKEKGLHAHLGIIVIFFQWDTVAYYHKISLVYLLTLSVDILLSVNKVQVLRGNEE